MTLDIQREMSAIREMYDTSMHQATFNALIYGTFGTGKTSLLKTCRKPVWDLSFDPGGSKVLLERNGKLPEGIYVDSRYELEDPKRPTIAEFLNKEFYRLKSENFFNNIGTLAVDSGTTLSSVMMNLTLKKAGRPAGVPQQNDYLPSMVMLENFIKDCTTLPCDFLFLCHQDADKDEATGKMFIGPLLVGKLKYRIPLLFDELYCAQTKETSAGLNYTLLTRSTGLYQARTRLGRGGLFEMYEEPDIKKLLAKAGYSTADKI